MDKGFFFLFSLFLRISSSCLDQSEDPQSMTGIGNSTVTETVCLEFMTSSRNTQEMSTEVEVFDDFASYSHIELKSGLFIDQSSEIQVMDYSKDLYEVAQGIETVLHSVRLFGTFLWPYFQPYVPRITSAVENVKLVFSDSVAWSISDYFPDWTYWSQFLLKFTQKEAKKRIGSIDCVYNQEILFQNVQLLGESGLAQAFGNTISSFQSFLSSPSAHLRTTVQTIIMLPVMFYDVLLNISPNSVFMFLSGIFGPKVLMDICTNIAIVPMTYVFSPSIPLYLMYPIVSYGCGYSNQIMNSVGSFMLPAEVVNSTVVESLQSYLSRYDEYHEEIDDECRPLKNPLGMKSVGLGNILEIWCQVWNAVQRLGTGQSYSGADAGLVLRYMLSR